MNKKTIIFGALFMLVSALSFGQSGEKMGGDKDAHGCKASAGYTFSIIKNECVRVFEQKIKLTETKPAGSSTSMCAVIFSADNKKAEVFLKDGAESSQILVRKGKKGHYSWTKGNLSLAKNKTGYELKKDNVIIYSGM